MDGKTPNECGREERVIPSGDYERRRIPEAATTRDLAASPAADEEPRISRANHSLSRFIAEGFRQDSPAGPTPRELRANELVQIVPTMTKVSLQQGRR